MQTKRLQAVVPHLLAGTAQNTVPARNPWLSLEACRLPDRVNTQIQAIVYQNRPTPWRLNRSITYRFWNGKLSAVSTLWPWDLMWFLHL